LNVKNIFKDSLNYSTKDWDKLLTLGVLFFIGGLLSLFPTIGIALNNPILTQLLTTIGNIVALIVVLIAMGYALLVVRDTINDFNEIPELNLIKNIFDGIKVFFVSVIYYVIALVIVTLIAIGTGVINNVGRIILIYLTYGPDAVIPSSILANSGDIIVIIIIIWIILVLISTLFLAIALSRMAKTDSIKAAFELSNIFADILKIGWMNYIILAILHMVILAIFFVIAIIISIIPFIGFVTVLLLIIPFLIIFNSRTLGLIYKKSIE